MNPPAPAFTVWICGGWLEDELELPELVRDGEPVSEADGADVIDGMSPTWELRADVKAAIIGLVEEDENGNEMNGQW